MHEILVSETVHDELARTQQWIGYDLAAMEEMASVLKAPGPAPEEPIYVFYEPDIQTKTIPGSPYAPPGKEPISTRVYRQGLCRPAPDGETPSVVPDNKMFTVVIGDNVSLDTPNLSAATAERLALPRRNRRVIAAAAFGGAIVLGSAFTANEAVALFVPATIVASSTYVALIALAARQHLPDTSTMRPPLVLRSVS